MKTLNVRNKLRALFRANHPSSRHTAIYIYIPVVLAIWEAEPENCELEASSCHTGNSKILPSTTELRKHSKSHKLTEIATKRESHIEEVCKLFRIVMSSYIILCPEQASLSLRKTKQKEKNEM